MLRLTFTGKCRIIEISIDAVEVEQQQALIIVNEALHATLKGY